MPVAGAKSTSVLWAITRFGVITCEILALYASLALSDCSNIRWNAARAFATYLDTHEDLYKGRNVLELGAGGGLPSLVTALNGARKVSLLLPMCNHPHCDQGRPYGLPRCAACRQYELQRQAKSV